MSNCQTLAHPFFFFLPLWTVTDSLKAVGGRKEGSAAWWKHLAESPPPAHTQVPLGGLSGGQLAVFENKGKQLFAYSFPARIVSVRVELMI